jgi:hypothetical protein
MKIVVIYKTSYGYFESEQGCKKRKEYDPYFGKKIPEIPVPILALLTQEGKYHPIGELKGSVDVK